MRTVEFQSVLRDAAGLAGFTLARLTETAKTQFITFIGRRAQEYWDHWWWNEAMRAEVRYYRDLYANDAVYAAEREVRYGTPVAYYRALQSTTGNLPTDTTYWEPITDLDPYIELEQTGEEPIGTVRQLSPDNPLTTIIPRQTPFRLAGDRIQVLGEHVLTSLYVWFREQAPTWQADDYSATETYAVDKVAYYSSAAGTVGYAGDFWRCLTATNPGENPETHAAKWERIGFPSWLKLPVAQAAYADWMRQDGNPEGARLEDAEAQRLLMKAIHRDGPAQRQMLRSSGA